MKFFIDTAEIEEIRQANLRGWVDGVTRPILSLIAKSGKPFHEVIKEICKEISGPVSAEVISLQAEEMFREGRELAKLASNVVVKVPMCEAQDDCRAKIQKLKVSRQTSRWCSLPMRAIMTEGCHLGRSDNGFSFRRALGRHCGC